MIKSYMVGKQKDLSISVMNGYAINVTRREDVKDVKSCFQICGNVIVEKCIQHIIKGIQSFVKSAGINIKTGQQNEKHKRF